MTLDEAKVRAIAKKLAREIRMGGWACRISDEVIDKLTDEELVLLKKWLVVFGLRMRKDFLWEKAD